MADQIRNGVRVLWPTDGSAGSAAAAAVLDRLAPQIGRLRILTVAPHQLVTGARPDPAFLTKITAPRRREALEAAQEVATEQALDLRHINACIEPRSVWGNPIQAILRQAGQFAPDLIVLGSKGHSNLRFLLLGSVSHGVVQHTKSPVLIVRPGHDALETVVVGYEGSTVSKQLLHFVVRLLPREARIILTRVVEPFVVPTGTPIAYRVRAHKEASDINHHLMLKAERSLADAKALLIAAGFTVETELLMGQPAAQLLDSAKRHKADLVAVGSRKPSAVRHYLLASTAEKLARHAEASVLVVR